jgi:benzoyl-CoA reductase/2-hydroxyglutaryl-CoA dehydratase subunit BcrC/BadD/HgdB
MEVPHTKTPLARTLWQGEVLAFKDVIEGLTGNRITAETLIQATKRVNARRRALKRLYNLRKKRPVPISGKDALLVSQVSFYDDVDRNTKQINALCDELDKRVAAGRGVFPADVPRILISGSPMAIPNWKLHHLIESAGAAVVCEESCIGTRNFSDLVPENGGSLDKQLMAIAERYMKINCACFTPNNGRIEDIIRLAKEHEADGVVHYNLQFCHTYANEAFRVEKAIEREGIPMLRIETDYSDEDTGQLRTRLDAFLEVIGR